MVVAHAVIAGSGESGSMIGIAPFGNAKRTSHGREELHVAFSSSMAARSEPAPASFVFVTSNCFSRYSVVSA